MDIIGKHVKVTIDRAMGTYHPEHKDLFYSINYGFIEGIMAPDGEWQDAYVLGTDHPVDEFCGVVIAVIHRLNDVEDKWVVVPEGKRYTLDDIKRETDFQERFFQTEILM